MSEKYFTNLNYTLANEDTSLELAILPEGVRHVFSVAGSGGRVLPLLAKHPRRVTCVDLSADQLRLVRLRLETFKSLSRTDFLGFWGYPPYAFEPNERKECFKRLDLDPVVEDHFRTIFERLQWGSILYEGRWERTFSKLSAINRRITGIKGLELFGAQTEGEHRKFLEEGFPKKAWRAVLLLLANAGIFNAFLYKGSFPKKNIPVSFFEYYTQAFDRLFNQGVCRKNFFLQIMFFGKVLFAEGLPIECDPDVFESVQRHIPNTDFHYLQGDILQEIQKVDTPVDFLSFSDVPSYFSGETERNFMQVIAPHLAAGALVIIRNYLHVPEGLNLHGFEDITHSYEAEIKKEKTQMYQVTVLKKVSPAS